MIEGDKDGPWTVSTLKAYFERIICELNRRLDALDRCHKSTLDRDRSFYSRDQHDVFAADVNRQMDQMRNEIEVSRRPQWTIWFGAMTLLMSVIGILWYLAVQPIKDQLATLRDTDKAFVQQMTDREENATQQRKIINDRIDRLYELYRDLQSQHADAMQKMQQKSPR